jgi:hypothetical protein
MLSIALFLFKNTAFRILGSFSFFKLNLQSWTQSIELVHISGYIHQRKVLSIKQAQHKPSAGG